VVIRLENTDRPKTAADGKYIGRIIRCYLVDTAQPGFNGIEDSLLTDVVDVDLACLCADCKLLPTWEQCHCRAAYVL
jgi:hypothetical protein